MADRERGIVTPEAVLLEFDTAKLGSRTVAIVLDLAIQFVAVLVALFVVGAATAGGLPDLAAQIFIVVALFAIFFGYPIAFETLWSGRTLGKAAMGLRVVTREGAPVRFRHAAIRGALALVDIYLAAGSVAVVTSLLSPEGQRLGDLAAGTLVLRERTAGARADAMRFPVPHGWERYVAGLDVSAVTTEQYGVIRDLLLRVNDLSSAARWHLGERLATPVAAEMNHRPPPGVAAETFLVCVAAAYQQRRGTTSGWATAAGVAEPPPGAAPRPTSPAPPPPPGARPVDTVPPPPRRPPAAPTPPSSPPRPPDQGGFAPPG